MPSLEPFYYTQKSTKIAYRITPSHRISVSRLIKNRSYWIAPTSADKPKPKTLILTDWTFGNWSFDKKTAVIAVLSQMMVLGFKVIIFDDLLDSPENLSEAIHRKRADITLYTAIEDPDGYISTSLKQHHLARDEVHLLNTYWIHYLLEERQPLCIYFSDYEYASEISGDTLDMEIFADIILSKYRTPRLNLIQDKFSRDVANHFDSLARTYSCFSLYLFPATTYHSVDLSVQEVKAVACGETIFHTLPSSPSMRLSLDLGKINTVRCMSLGVGNELSSVVTLLNKTHQLEKLQLYSSAVVSDGCPNTLNTLPVLNKLDFSTNAPQMSGASLVLFLKAMPALETMNLRLGEPGRHGVISDIDLTPRSLNALQQTYLERAKMSTHSLTHILNAAPNITRFWADDLILSGPVDIDINPLLNLEAMNLAHTTIEAHVLNAWLNAAPKLCYLTLTSAKILSDGLRLPMGCLPSLVSLNLGQSDIQACSLTALLQAAPNLKNLEIGGCKSLRLDDNLRRLIKPIYHNLTPMAGNHLII